jgi:hypothetical protein
VKPRLSVVLVSYNMRRELPRTVRSLSPSMQRGISGEEYELIIVDNGSTMPFPEASCRQWAPNVFIHRLAAGDPSPVRAVNLGLERASGELVCVCIDGARMASPGMLASGLAASRLHDRAVIGTLAFHLGPDLQRKSMALGYNQAVEDELLAGSGWEEDGYRLFNISVFAGSSDKGWFVLPNESNAMFLRASHWASLGGFDERFVTPGGGLVNLDTWARACEDPDAQVIMLLGEATFHQFHGGVATNSLAPPKADFKAEYLRLRGRPFVRPDAKAWYFGRPNRTVLDSMRRSLDLWADWTEAAG